MAQAKGERDGGEDIGGDANFHRQYDRQIRLWGLAAQQRMTSAFRALIFLVLSSAERFPRSCPWLRAPAPGPKKMRLTPCGAQAQESWCVACAGWPRRLARTSCSPVLPGTHARAHALSCSVARSWATPRPFRLTRSLLVHSPSRGPGSEGLTMLGHTGVGHVAMMDSTVVTQEDLGCQFFLSEDDVGKRTRAEASVDGLQVP